MIILDTVGVALLDIIMGLLIRVIFGGVIYKFIPIKALVTGVPFLGIIAWAVFPSFNDNSFVNVGFYLTDFAATALFFTKKDDKNATTN